MVTATRILTVAGALALGAGLSAAQNSNDSTFNNGGDVIFFYSDPSSGSTSGAVPANINGDLYFRIHRGNNFMNDVDASLGGSLMEVDGYYESLFDSDWSTTPHFYVRAHTFEFSSGLPNLTRKTHEASVNQPPFLG